MEDQPTDASDLTDTDDTTKDTAPARGAVPVGKRAGRHRTFRPRPVAAAPAATDTTVDDTPDETSADTVDTKLDEAPNAATAEVAAPERADAEPEATDAESEAAAPTPKAKRRRWFRGRSAAASVQPTEAEAVDEPADAATEVPAEEPVDITEATESTDDEPVAEPAAPKPVGRRMAIAVAVAAVLFVAAGAFGGAMLQPYLADRAVADTKLDIARTATAAITTLFTYTPEDMDQLSARTAKYLGGELKESYPKQVDALAATNKQNQIHRSAQVVGAAVESLDGPNATAMVYANVTYTSAATKDVPKIFLVSYRLTMQRKGSDWVITNMPWITSKDLTRLSP